MKVKKLDNNNREEILRVEGLKQWFRLGSGKNMMLNKAVDGVSFTIYKGEVFSLVGESGCGKTTTGRTIIKLYQSSGGEVFFHGTRIVSDVKDAKLQYKEKISGLKENKEIEIKELNQKLQETKINKEEFDRELLEMNNRYQSEELDAKDILKAAKRDRRFESIREESAKKAKHDINTFPEYKAIVSKYEAANIETKKRILELQPAVRKAKEKLANFPREDKDSYAAEKVKYGTYVDNLKKAQKELKLNGIRQKQDISNLKYGLVHRNRLLMRKMQMIFQDPIASLNPRMTVQEIIAEGLIINGVRNEREIDDRVKAALKTVGLVPEHASRYPHEFSGGQRQRIGIARALVVEPSFIIADEPISALDVSIRAQIINLLNDLRETKGITIMFIAHDLSVVKYFSDRVAVMYFGHIVEIGAKDAIFDHPLHPYTLSLMESIPLPDPVYEKQRGRTVRYNPAKQHDYSKEQPTLREVETDHFVLCNTEEYNKYQEKLNKK
jgi:oligopeptide transport system ATP-binding protein